MKQLLKRNYCVKIRTHLFQIAVLLYVLNRNEKTNSCKVFHYEVHFSLAFYLWIKTITYSLVSNIDLATKPKFCPRKFHCPILNFNIQKNFHNWNYGFHLFREVVNSPFCILHKYWNFYIQYFFYMHIYVCRYSKSWKICYISVSQLTSIQNISNTAINYSTIPTVDGNGIAFIALLSLISRCLW